MFEYENSPNNDLHDKSRFSYQKIKGIIWAVAMYIANCFSPNHFSHNVNNLNHEVMNPRTPTAEDIEFYDKINWNPSDSCQHESNTD